MKSWVPLDSRGIKRKKIEVIRTFKLDDNKTNLHYNRVTSIQKYKGLITTTKSKWLNR